MHWLLVLWGPAAVEGTGRRALLVCLGARVVEGVGTLLVALGWAMLLVVVLPLGLCGPCTPLLGGLPMWGSMASSSLTSSRLCCGGGALTCLENWQPHVKLVDAVKQDL
jgi:hypothetical protein